ncbi:MAG: hypothetical protein ABI175_10115, partial [Polyangiales bacterium]
PQGAGGPAGGASPGSSASAAPTYPLLEGLKPGDVLDEWTVSRIVLNESEEKKPQLAIELERKGSGITIWVARLGNAKNPALSTAKYGLTFGHARVYGEPIPEGAYDKMMKVIAERLRRTEATVEPPVGL